MSRGGLPGGLSPAQARWLAFRHHHSWGQIAYLSLMLPFVAVLAVAWVGSVSLVGLVLVAYGLLWWLALRYTPRGAVVDARHRPELHTLVEQVAGRTGTRMPDRVWLTVEPVVSVEVVAGLRHLRIGLPLLDCVTPAQLQALVGYQLALLGHRHPKLVVTLFEYGSKLLVDELWDPDGEPSPAFPDELRDFVAEVQRVADRTTVTAAGGTEPAARAFALAWVVADEYDTYLRDSGIPERRWWRLYEVAIHDVHDGWQRALRRGLGETGWDEDEARELAVLHPALSAPLTALGSAPLPLRPAPDTVPVTPLTPREQRRVVRHLRNLDLPTYVRWTTFEQAPEAWWRRRARVEAQDVRENAAEVLGREPVDDVEVFATVRDRPREVLAATLGVAVEELPDGPAHQATHDVLVWLVEANLLGRGWRLEHPAVRGVLLGPDGERVDARELIAAAERDLETLRPWLAPPPASLTAPDPER